jgi:hypothetical protein
MNIIIEGLWFSPKEQFIEQLAKDKPDWVDHIAPCPAVSPTGDFKSWMTSLTKASEQWRARAASGDIVVFENSPHSITAYTEILARSEGVLGDQEHGLLVSIIEGLSELLPKADVVILLLCKPLDTPKRHAGLHKKIPLHVIEELQMSLVHWAEGMRDQEGARVIAVAPPKKDQTWESWYHGTLHILQQIVSQA